MPSIINQDRKLYMKQMNNVFLKGFYNTVKVINNLFHIIIFICIRHTCNCFLTATVILNFVQVYPFKKSLSVIKKI